MFKDIIGSTGLTTEDANEFFHGRVGGYSWNGDVSFISTLRAVVYPKLKDGESVHFYYERINLNDICTRVFSARFIEIRETLFVLYPKTDGFSGVTPDTIARKFCDVNKDFEQDKQVTDFFTSRQKNTEFGTVLFFFNKETRTSVIISENMTTQIFHILQAPVMAYFPWYFPEGYKLSDIEMEIAKSLTMTSHKPYMEAMIKVAAQYDFELGKIKRLLSDFNVVNERREIESIQRDISYIDTQISTAKSEMRRYLKNRNKQLIILQGLTQALEENKNKPSEVEEFFAKNRDELVLSGVDGGEITFAVKTYLEIFDEECARRIIENKKSFIYLHDFQEEDIRILFTHLFIEQDVRLRICAAYSIERTYVSGRRNFDFSRFNGVFDTYLPNPHINKYECLGDYDGAIMDLLDDGDMVGAIQQCIASCMSLNFADGTVINSFLDTLRRSDKKVFEMPDGQILSTTEAIDWLKATYGEEETDSNGEKD